MDNEPTPDSPAAPDPTPVVLLDQIRAHPEWTEPEREAVLDRIVTRFPAEAIVAAVRDRLSDLGGPDAEALLRLVEVNPHPPLLRALAEAIEAQPELPPERAWEALAVLHGAGVLDQFPDLAERWDELVEVIEEDEASVEQLVAEIEGDPDSVGLALQGLGAVEPDVRAAIVAGIARGDTPVGPGLADFLRLLAYTHDPATRVAALDALSNRPGADDPARLVAWHDLARHHPDPAVADSARRRVDAARPAATRAVPPAVHASPRITRSFITSVDGGGRARIVLGSVLGTRHATAVFVCDVTSGVPEVFGELTASPALAATAWDEYAEGLHVATVVGDDHPLALGLLAGCLTLCGPETPPALRYWVEATAGPGFRPRPFSATFPDWDPSALPFEEIDRRVRDVLDACPDWLDDSPLTFELAEEIALREGEAPVDPRRDAGAYRFLFEHRLSGQLERYRRMLLWMAWLWRSGGSDDLARSALGLAWQLSDAQHDVPGHPFAVALTTRSLDTAREGLKRGIDPRGRSAR